MYHRLDSSDEYASNVLLLQETLRECEITQMALDCIRVGARPSLSGNVMLCVCVCVCGHARCCYYVCLPMCVCFYLCD